MIGPRIKIGIILSLTAALGVIGWLYKQELKRGAEQAAAIIQQRAEIQDKEKRIKDLARQLDAAEAAAAREKARAVSIRQEAKRLRDEIERLERENEAVGAWADARMPADLYRLLRPAANGRQD